MKNELQETADLVGEVSEVEAVEGHLDVADGLFEVASSNSTTSKREEDLNTIVDLVWLDLQGSISRDIVRQTVSSLYKEYNQAKVRSFIPVIVQRRAKALLLKGSYSEISNQQLEPMN